MNTFSANKANISLFKQVVLKKLHCFHPGDQSEIGLVHDCYRKPNCDIAVALINDKLERLPLGTCSVSGIMHPTNVINR